MLGHQPIFATLVTGIFRGMRNLLYKMILEPKSHEERKTKEAKTEEKRT